MTQQPPLPHEDLATYAHELRGALTIIAGYTELLRRPLPSAERESALDGIERAIRRADILCSDALSGRPPASATHALEPISLVMVAEQVVADLRSATGRTIDVTTEGRALVLGDEDALARVLGNLIDNAAKYSLRDAPIEVRVAEGEGAFGPMAFVEIADRGPGIPEDELLRIVEPFARLDRDAATPGSGLGLSIAHNVAQGHDGRLTFAAREGGGTVTRIELPRA